MKTIEISATKRKSTGKTSSKDTRFAERVPCVLYGNGDPEHFDIDYIALDKSLSTPNTYLYTIDVDGQKTQAIIREKQFHPVSDRVLHVDFLRVNDTKAVELELPVKLTGIPAGVGRGGVLQPLTRKIKVRGIVTKLPDIITIDVTQLELGKTIKVEDVQLENITITSPASAGIAAVIIPRALKTTTEAGTETETETETEAAPE